MNGHGDSSWQGATSGRRYAAPPAAVMNSTRSAPRHPTPAWRTLSPMRALFRLLYSVFPVPTFPRGTFPRRRRLFPVPPGAPGPRCPLFSVPRPLAYAPGTDRRRSRHAGTSLLAILYSVFGIQGAIRYSALWASPRPWRLRGCPSPLPLPLIANGPAGCRCSPRLLSPCLHSLFATQNSSISALSAPWRLPFAVAFASPTRAASPAYSG